MPLLYRFRGGMKANVWLYFQQVTSGVDRYNKSLAGVECDTVDEIESLVDRFDCEELRSTKESRLEAVAEQVFDTLYTVSNNIACLIKPIFALCPRLKAIPTLRIGECTNYANHFRGLTSFWDQREMRPHCCWKLWKRSTAIWVKAVLNTSSETPFTKLIVICCQHFNTLEWLERLPFNCTFYRNWYLQPN